MNFSEEKQAEFEAFCAFVKEFAKRKYDSTMRSGKNQILSFANGQYKGGGLEIVRKLFKAEPLPKVERTVKTSGGSQRRNAPPQQGNAPQPGTPRYERLKAKGRLESKSVTPGVVAEVEPEKKERQRTRKEIVEQVSAYHKKELEAQIWERETPIIHLSTDAEFDTETGRTVNDLLADASIKGAGEFSAKDLLEKYGDGARDFIFEKLVELGHDADVLGEKSDRQLANLLKKEAVK